MEVESLTLEEWSEHLPTDGVEVFHSPEVLRVLADHASGELRLMAGFRGEQLVGLLPVFLREFPFTRAVVSPPPGLSVPRMGPVLNQQSPKRRKQESVNRTFIQEVLEALATDKEITLFGMVCSPEYADPRPYLWEGFDVSPRFTYRLDLEDENEEDLIMSFTRDLRYEIREGDDLDVVIRKEGAEAAGTVHDALRERYEEQGIDFPTPRPFTRDLVAALGDRARVYVARDQDGTFLSGVTVLYSPNEGYFWHGGATTSYQGVSVNSLLHWRIIQDILTDPELESISRYDLGVVNDYRLSRYKSKYTPELVPYYEVKSGKLMSLAKKAYQRLTY